MFWFLIGSDTDCFGGTHENKQGKRQKAQASPRMLCFAEVVKWRRQRFVGILAQHTQSQIIGEF